MNVVQESRPSVDPGASARQPQEKHRVGKACIRPGPMHLPVRINAAPEMVSYALQPSNETSVAPMAASTIACLKAERVQAGLLHHKRVGVVVCQAAQHKTAERRQLRSPIRLQRAYAMLRRELRVASAAAMRAGTWAEAREQRCRPELHVFFLVHQLAMWGKWPRVFGV